MTAFRRLCAATILIASTTLFAQTASGFGVQIPWRFLIGAEKPVADYNAPPLPADFHSRSPDQNEQAPTSAPSAEIDLSPRFASRLPYSVALGRVVIESNFPLESAQGLEAEIVQLQNDLVGFLGVPEAQEKISLCLFNDMESYRAFIAETFRGAPTDRPALYVKDSGPGVLMVPRNDRMLLNIRHEMTHAYLNAALRNVPIWIDEGLAKYFEIPPGERGFRNPYLTDAEQGVSGLFGAPPSLPRLERLTRVDQMKTREYRESWSWVHYMIHYSPRTQRLLAGYLRSLSPEAQKGVTMQEAFKRQKKLPLTRMLEEHQPNYKKEYVEHFKNWDARRTAYESARQETDTVGRAQANGIGSRQ
ncbi:MAG: hypothetical protein PHO46_03065 [Thermoguttaceae bacterium]|jgi:hypothetical protein|nr:hypothetical protein [Thermoguttaceae bacterium]